MIEQLKHFAATDRGNVMLTCEDCDDFSFYGRLPSGGWLEVTYRLGNYPKVNVAALDISDEQLAQHINDKLQGWFVDKANVNGLNIDQAGCIAEQKVADLYENGECPDCGEPIRDDATLGGECVNCGHVWTGPQEKDA